MVSNKLSLYIEKSVITGCINTVLTNGFIEVSQSSELQIVDSNITDNSVVETGTLIYGSSKSTLKIKKSLFVKNNMARLIVVGDNSNVFLENLTFIKNRVIASNVKPKALVVSNGSSVYISDCYFFKNVVVSTMSSSMLLMVNSKILILKTKFIKNTINGNIDGSILIKIGSSYATNVTNNIFRHNLFNAVFSVRSPSADSKSFFVIENCSLISNFLDSIFTENVQNILIRKVLSRVIPEIEIKLFPYGILIHNTKNLRIKESLFNATDWTSQIYFEQTYFQTMLFTMDSVFFDDNSTLTTNSSNFFRMRHQLDIFSLTLYPQFSSKNHHMHGVSINRVFPL